MVNALPTTKGHAMKGVYSAVWHTDSAQLTMHIVSHYSCQQPEK